MNKQQLAELKRIKAILSAVTGLEDDDQEYIEDARKALQSIISQDALDKKAENARDLGLDYEPAPVQEKNQSPYPEYDRGFSNGWDRGFAAAQPAPVQEKCFLCGERVDSCASDVCPKSAQPAVQEGRDWSLLAATQESLREHMAEIKRLKAAQPVKTYSGGKPWPVAPAPDPAPIIQQLVTALEGSGTRMRSDQWYVEIEAVAAGKFYLNSKGEGL
jgi:hypothetical protein